MNICEDWKGSYSNGKDCLKITFGKSCSEMLILLYHTDGGPPSLVARFDSRMSPWPFKKNHPASFHHVRSNYCCELKEFVLQKVEVINSSAPDENNSWTVAVSEFQVEVDFFKEVAPDDESKCLRKVVFSTFAKDKLLVDSWYKAEQESKTKVFEKNATFTEFDNIFETLEDRRIGEAKANNIFQLYHQEKWLINDGILENALVKVEEEEGQVKKFGKELDRLVLPGQGFVEEPEDVTKAETFEESDECITEDSLWERDVFEENLLYSFDNS